MGQHRPEGYEYQAPNGYWYVKKDGQWVLKHHIIAAEKIGRPIDTSVHRVIFVDKDPNNLDPDNIEVREKKGGKAQRIAALKAKIARLEEELRELEGA